MHMLSKMTVTVHANKSVVSMKVLASKSSLPIDRCGVESTSAAMPAFQANPSDALHAATN